MASSKSPSLPTEPAPPAAASTPDVALVHHVTPDGTVHVIRRRGDQLEAGALSPLKEGAPIQGEVLSLRPRENFPMLCDVDVLYTPPAAKPTDKATAAAPAPRRKGPAQVATNDYRDNWDSIWARKKSNSVN
jgi:hypothetical protein